MGKDKSRKGKLNFSARGSAARESTSEAEGEGDGEPRGEERKPGSQGAKYKGKTSATARGVMRNRVGEVCGLEVDRKPSPGGPGCVWG
jgi:hypothetical protein